MKLNHTLVLVVVVAFGLSLVPSSRLPRTRASSAAGSIQEPADLRGFLSGPITARAADRGNPSVTLRNGTNAPVQYHGASKLVEQLKTNATRPLSVGAADFDEDGVQDFVAGYAGTQNGLISIQRGDVDTIYPNTREAIANRAQLRASAALPPSPDEIQSPFFVLSRTFEISSAPAFLGTGDFDGDGHRDVVTAANGGGALVLLSGDGQGGFAPARSITVPGKVTSMATGDVNRIDGLADIMVAVKGSGVPKLLIFEGPAGGLNAVPEMISLPSSQSQLPRDSLMTTFRLTSLSRRDASWYCPRWDRKHSTDEGKKLDADPPVVTRIAVSFSIASVAIGDFTGDLRHEIALLSDDGVCHVFARTGSGASGWQQASAVAVPIDKTASTRAVLPVRISSSPKDDLLVLDQAGRRMQILVNDSAVVSDDGAKGLGH
jgi:hypothetical protein